MRAARLLFAHSQDTCECIALSHVLTPRACTQTQRRWGATTAVPEEVGMSSTRLDRLEQFQQDMVDQERLPCTHLVVARHGRTVRLPFITAITRLSAYTTITRLHASLPSHHSLCVCVCVYKCVCVCVCVCVRVGVQKRKATAARDCPVR